MTRLRDNLTAVSIIYIDTFGNRLSRLSTLTVPPCFKLVTVTCQPSSPLMSTLHQLRIYNSTPQHRALTHVTKNGSGDTPCLNPSATPYPCHQMFTLSSDIKAAGHHACTVFSRLLKHHTSVPLHGLGRFLGASCTTHRRH